MFSFNVLLLVIRSLDIIFHRSDGLPVSQWRGRRLERLFKGRSNSGLGHSCNKSRAERAIELHFWPVERGGTGTSFP